VSFLQGWAQVDTINWRSKKLLLNKIHEGVNRYLVYTVDSATNKIGSSDIWVRTTKIVQKRSQQLFHFEWQWFHHESEYRYVAADCRKIDLAPVYQYGKIMGSITAYNFADGFMSAADSVTGNKADPMKKIALTIPVFNWEWDMELFSALPFRQVGQRFMIAFLDPSGGEPSYYEYKVTSREDLKLNERTKISCWLLRIEYEPGAYGTFWIAEQSGEMLKMKELYKGSYRYKVKLY
jgi:hypothetical protein